MLDPLTALGVAGNVVQLAEFGAKILVESRTVYLRGASVQVQDLSATTQKMVAVSTLLKRSQYKGSVVPSEEEAALYDLVDQCIDTAQEFVLALEKLTVNGKAAPWRSVRAALLTVWSRGKLEEMSRRLDRFKTELALSILVLLNKTSDAQATHQDHRFDRLDRSNDDIVEVISITQEKWRSAIEDTSSQLDRVEDNLRDLDLRADQRQAETVAAILTLRGGQTKTLTTVGSQLATGPKQRFGDSTTMMTLQAASEEEEFASAGIQDYNLTREKVLECLHFRQMGDRMDVIAQAHRTTCEWIFHNPTRAKKPWSSFIDWLESGRGCYWVNGKAGSGKSTLMRYINRDPRYIQALEKWARDTPLVTASFFMWNLGSTLQKSQTGLLRTLLYDVLSRFPTLIPLVVPDLCRAAAKSRRLDSLAEPSFAEVMKGFRSLVEQRSMPLRICFLIDGLDEYEGDLAELVSLFESIAVSTNLKIVVSSRPLPVCVAAFTACPSLRLQDLTHNDIQTYVDDKLHNDKNLIKLRVVHGIEVSELIKNLVEKAAGVFLWVALAVRSLQEGLRNFDSIKDLQVRLDELPPDLEKVYDHMLNTMPKVYRHQAAKLFRLVLLSMDVQAETPILALQLAYAEDEEVPLTLERQMKTVNHKEASARVEVIEGRIRSRCCGLMELQEYQSVGGPRRLPSVSFFHKTVVEFLREPKIWTDILSQTTGMDFDPATALMASCISLAKVLPAEKTINCRNSLVWQSMRLGLRYAYLAQISTQRPLTDYLDELDRVISAHWTVAVEYCPDPLTLTKIHDHWSVGEATAMNITRPEAGKVSYDCFLSTAVDSGLSLFVEDKLSRDPEHIIKNKGHSLLKQSLRIFFQKKTSDLNYLSRNDTKASAEIIEALLHYGADPNHVDAQGFSPWQSMIQHAVASQNWEHHVWLKEFDAHGHAEYFTKLLVRFIAAGANPNASEVYVLNIRRSVLLILQSLLRQSLQQKFGVRDDQRPRPQERVEALEEYYKHISKMLVDKGAESKEWQETPQATPPQQQSLHSVPQHGRRTADQRARTNNITSPISVRARSWVNRWVTVRESAKEVQH